MLSNIPLGDGDLEEFDFLRDFGVLKPIESSSPLASRFNLLLTPVY